MVTALPSFAELYPDVVTAGSLAAALGQVAEDLGLDLGAVEFADPVVTLEWASVTSTAPAGRPFRVRVTPVERTFEIDGRCADGRRLRGTTSDLAEVARAAAAWRTGATLPEIQRATPFVAGAE